MTWRPPPVPSTEPPHPPIPPPHDPTLDYVANMRRESIWWEYYHAGCAPCYCASCGGMKRP